MRRVKRQLRLSSNLKRQYSYVWKPLLWVCLACFFIGGYLTDSLSAQPVPKKESVKVLRPIEPITYSYFENFNGMLLLPDGPPPYPAIIYSYDEFYELAGIGGAMKQGYDLAPIIRTFQSWGFAVLVPERRHHNPKSVKGAIRYLQAHKDIDSRAISLVGVSEGGFLSLLGCKDEKDLAALILLAPKSIHDTGSFSIVGLHRMMPRFSTPTLMLVGNEAPNSDVMSGRSLRKVLVMANKELEYKEYYVNKRWFWNSSNRFMDDIKRFIQQRIGVPIQKNPLLDYRG